MDGETKNPVDMTDEEFAEYLALLAEEDAQNTENNPSVSSADSSLYTREPQEGAHGQSGAPHDPFPMTAEGEPEQNSAQETSDNSYSAYAQEQNGQSDTQDSGSNILAEAAADRSGTQELPRGGDISRRLEDYARYRYPDSDNPTEELMDEFEEELAAQRGMNAEDYRRSRAEELEFEQWKQERESRKNADENAQKVISEWESDAQKLKEFVPSFDLKQALANEQFRQRLLTGENVIKAYRALNPSVKEEPRERFIDEVGRDSSGSARGSVERDVSQMSDREFREYIRKLEEE